MKTYDKYCRELMINGGILKKSHFTCYFKPGYTLHRVDSPAVEWTGGDKHWYYNSKQIMKTTGDVTPGQLLDFKLRIL